MINLYSKLFLHRLGSKTSSNIDLILPEVCEFNRYKKNSNLGYQQFRKRSIDKIVAHLKNLKWLRLSLSQGDLDNDGIKN